MRKFTILLLIFALLVCMAACGKTPVTNTDDPTQSSTTPTESTDPTDPVQPADPLMLKIQKLLENKDRYDLYNYALLSEFSTPADVNLYNLFAYGFKNESKFPTQQEIDLMGSWIWDDRTELRRLPVDKMNAALTEVFGITLDQTNLVGLDRLWYIEETDCYYGYLYSGDYAVVDVRKVEEQDDGTLKVYYRRGRGTYQDMIVTLKPAGESYQILSNVYANPMVGEMQNLLDVFTNKPFYNDALVSTYETPADVDLFYLFYNGFEDESQTATKQEEKLLDGKLHASWKETDLVRLPVEKMDAVLMELFGITLDETNGVGLGKLAYLKETDCYYHTVTGASYADVTVVYTEILEDGSVMVQYSADYQGNRMAKLMPMEDGSYQILSNTKVTYIYNQSGVMEAVNDYFEQRKAYLMGISAEIPIANSGILADEASHAATIISTDVGWLGSEVAIQVNGCWDSHAEAIATETVKFNVNGAEKFETVVHMIHAFLTSDGEVIISSDGYREITTGFTSASYVPPELQ